MFLKAKKGNDSSHELAQAILVLAHELSRFGLADLKLEILKKISETESRIMSKISDFAAAQKTFNDRLDVAVDGLVGDIKSLNDKIKELQDSAGQVTPEDQVLLDDLQARAEAMTAKVEALDALTPPVVVVPPA